MHKPDNRHKIWNCWGKSVNEAVVVSLEIWFVHWAYWRYNGGLEHCPWRLNCVGDNVTVSSKRVQDYAQNGHLFPEAPKGWD